MPLNFTIWQKEKNFAPKFVRNPPSTITIGAGETIKLDIPETFDQNNDEVTLTIEGLNEEAIRMQDNQLTL